MSTQAYTRGFDVVPDGCDPNHFALSGGDVLQGGVLKPVAAAVIYMEDDETRYIECNAAGTVSSNITGWTAYSAPLWKITTASGLYTEVEDWRGKSIHEVRELANDLVTYLTDGKLTTATLTVSVSLTPIKYTITAGTIFRISGVCYYKGTETVAFTSANTINVGVATCAAGMWGAWSVNIAASGTLSSVAPAADQVYLTEAAAIAALTAPVAGTVKLGHITVNSNIDSGWTANTDDLTAASDCIGSFYYNTPAAKTLPTAVT
jgi:hypothetical protein